MRLFLCALFAVVAASVAGRAQAPGGGGQFAGKELVTRGFRWALKKEPIAIPPAVAPGRRGGGSGQ